jgi:hypothetical protein
MTEPIDPARLRELFHYDEDSGLLRWKVDDGKRRIGEIAGTPSPRGYRGIRLFGTRTYVHRVIWALKTGEWPPQDIDHIDGNPANNRWANLRSASRQQNLANRGRRSDNQAGRKGVGKSLSRWRARIRTDGVEVHLGSFATREEAHAAYTKAARSLWGEFADVDPSRT